MGLVDYTAMGNWRSERVSESTPIESGRGMGTAWGTEAAHNRSSLGWLDAWPLVRR